MSLLTKIKKENENEGSHATKFTRANPQVMMSVVYDQNNLFWFRPDTETETEYWP